MWKWVDRQEAKRNRKKEKKESHTLDFLWSSFVENYLLNTTYAYAYAFLFLLGESDKQKEKKRKKKEECKRLLGNNTNKSKQLFQ